jgi:hypothetical protein
MTLLYFNFLLYRSPYTVEKYSKVEQCPQWVEWSGVSPFSTPLHTDWSGVEWSGALLHGLHGVVVKRGTQIVSVLEVYR